MGLGWWACGLRRGRTFGQLVMVLMQLPILASAIKFPASWTGIRSYVQFLSMASTVLAFLLSFLPLGFGGRPALAAFPVTSSAIC